MPIFPISFGNSTTTIACNDSRAVAFLSFLFGDVSGSGGASSKTVSLHYEPDSSEFILSDNDKTLHRGDLDVECAARLYDIVIYHLLNEADSGIALHAGAVTCRNKVIILPGMSGAGKSTLTAWLATRGCSYLSDELIFISNDNPAQVFYFSRPICLKPGSVPLFDELINGSPAEDRLSDHSGAVLSHRTLNAEFIPRSTYPDIILFPDFQADASPCIEPISTARAITLLMGCHVNARNLEQHGFRQIVKLAGTTSAYRLRYRTFREAETCLADLFTSWAP